MLAQRLLVTIVLLPVALYAIYLGGPVFAVLLALVFGVAAWEYARLFRLGGFQPSVVLAVLGSAGLVLGRAVDGFESAPWIITLLVLASMTYHLIAYERGRDQAGTDFSITLGGALYIGWLGAYLISLRALPDGEWWLLTALPTVWLADSGAYFVGLNFGRRPLSPRLSPKKTWEGYVGGVVTGVLSGALLAALWRISAGPDSALTPWAGALLGLALSTLTPLGDLGESMIKRQVGVKDSSNLLPGHGGMFDRVDSWLWAGPIAYYLIVWFLR